MVVVDTIVVVVTVKVVHKTGSSLLGLVFHLGGYIYRISISWQQQVNRGQSKNVV